MSRSCYQYLVVGLENVAQLHSRIVTGLGMQIVWTLPPPRPNPDGDVRSLRSCSPIFVRFAMLVAGSLALFRAPKSRVRRNSRHALR